MGGQVPLQQPQSSVGATATNHTPGAGMQNYLHSSGTCLAGNAQSQDDTTTITSQHRRASPMMQDEPD